MTTTSSPLLHQRSRYSDDPPSSTSIDTYSSTSLTPFESMESDSPTQQTDFPENGQESDERAMPFSLDLAMFPKPIWLPWPLRAVDQKTLAVAISNRIGYIGSLLNRPPNEAEMTAVAFHTAHAYRIKSYGRPLGVLAGAYRAWTTRSTFKFPFTKPAATFIPDVVAISGRVLLSGSLARLFWHASRTSGYLLIGGSVGNLLLASYGATVGAVGQMQDTRLVHVVEASRQVQLRNTPMPGARNTGTQERQRRNMNGKDSVNADGSPRAIGETDEPGMSYNTDMASDEGEFSRASDAAEKLNRYENSDPTPSTSYDEPNRGSRSTSTRRWSPSQQGSETGPSKQADFFGGDDDASPVARDSRANSGNNSSSSWAKIRQETASKTQPRGSPNYERQQGQEVGLPDRHEEGDRQIERDAAQREFDKLLEKERNAYQGNDGNKNW